MNSCPGTSDENYERFVNAFTNLEYLESLHFGFYVETFEMFAFLLREEEGLTEEIASGIRTLKKLPKLKYFCFQKN